MFGDEAAMIVLVMADNKRKFREEYASEDEETTEETVARTTAYFAGLKDKNPDLARKIEFSVKNYDNLPRKEIEDAGFDYQVIDEWVDYVGVEDENLVEFERCSDCEGEGIIITKYYPATRYDPADADFEKCEMCFGSGEIDPAEYMDKDGNYMAESWLTEGKCAICNSPSKFTVMTAIGERSFCCEACYADYVGLPVEEEGYYGLASEDEDLFDCAVCDKTIYENDDPQDDEICNDCLKNHKQCAVCQDYEPYNEMTSCFVCGQNYCAACDKYDSCEEMNAE